ncbi:5-formyltetrahydrofolate cyclo-ligase [Sphingomonas guangdongensis]|uniref:5-formyltetrahydrofolate cyclo-ligase n=1 Tax=Sphingomonas guangdongensis TaxID=1141890 RepID=A0A285R611_9SPHN|nr:5-formyltetrahydrofolate cyclo-ligase [Sphingomonas guangdongensis]SOB87777.1 5-formyltetrahydrofolate cyclo-ligase [Sphingomonas guangdongensis]
MSDEKRILRARMRAERDAFAMTCDAMIAPPAVFLDRLTADSVVASYIAVGSEADPAPLAAAARLAGCTLVLPHVESRTAPLRFLLWREADPLPVGALGLRQPDAAAPEVAPDIILTPLVAFDDRLNRLGQGAGHYDRAFARFPDAWRLGVAWSAQHLLQLETEAWDVPLHAVVTERGMVQ